MRIIVRKRPRFAALFHAPRSQNNMSANCVHKTILILALFEFLFAAGIIAVGVVDIVFHSSLYFVGHGIWSGTWLGMAAVLGISAGVRHVRHHTCLCCSGLVVHSSYLKFYVICL